MAPNVPPTAAAVACSFSWASITGRWPRSGFAIAREIFRWTTRAEIALVTGNTPINYLAQAIYSLGDDGYAKLFPESKQADRLTWSKYRQVIFDYLASRQAADGSLRRKAISGPDSRRPAT